MFDIFVAESPAILANCKSDSMTTRAVISTQVLGIEGIDRSTTFYADGHLTCDR